MHFYRRASVAPRRLGVFSGTYHPPTRAHLALAHAALSLVDEVLFVLPRAFPHKQYEGVTFDDRIALLVAATAAEPRSSVAATNGGLFLEIAAECRAAYTGSPDLHFLCGRDAAERIVYWDYASGPSISEQLATYGLLVADRQGSYQPPPELAARIRPLPLSEAFDDVSATEVRRRIAAREPWHHLVPEPIHAAVERLYTPRG